MKTTTLLRVAKAQENYQIAQEIGGSTPAHRGWQMTLLFYSALFWIRAYFQESEIVDNPSHVKRLAAVRRTHELMAIAEDFSDLQDLSEDARYELEETSQARVDYAHAAYERLYAHIWKMLNSGTPSSEILEQDAD